jgi:hypothetical protein
MLLIGVLLVVLAAFSLWRQMAADEFGFGKIIFTVWLPSMAGGLMVIVSIVLLVAKAIKAM